MANSKISALTAATTPLAGTEVLPVVQSGATKQVSVANLTAGRSIAVNDVVASGELVSTTNNARISLYRSTGTCYFDWASGQTLAFGTETSQGGAGRVNKVNFTDAGNIEIANGNLVPSTAAKGVNFTANTGAAGMTSQLLNWYEEGTWTPTDGSGAGLTFATATGKYARIGRQVTITFVVVYPTTANTNTATISGLPFAASGNYVGACINNKVSAQAYIPNGTSAINLYTLNSLDDWKNSAVSGGTIIGTVTYMV